MPPFCYAKRMTEINVTGQPGRAAAAADPSGAVKHRAIRVVGAVGGIIFTIVGAALVILLLLWLE